MQYHHIISIKISWQQQQIKWHSFASWIVNIFFGKSASHIEIYILWCMIAIQFTYANVNAHYDWYNHSSLGLYWSPSPSTTYRFEMSNVITSSPVSFPSILWCCHTRNHPQGDLPKFGCRPAMKQKFIKTLLYTGYLLEQCV